LKAPRHALRRNRPIFCWARHWGRNTLKALLPSRGQEDESAERWWPTILSAMHGHHRGDLTG